MKISTSSKVFIRWCNKHYGICTMTMGIIGLLLAGYQTIRLQNQSVILDYKMEKIEAAVEEEKQIERQRIEYDSAVQNDVREAKGYLKGKADNMFEKFIIALPEDYKEVKKRNDERRKR